MLQWGKCENNLKIRKCANLKMDLFYELTLNSKLETVYDRMLKKIQGSTLQTLKLLTEKK